MATDLGTPARYRFLTAVRRRSWNIFPGTPALSHASFHVSWKSRTGRPFQWNTEGTIVALARSVAVV